MKENTKLDIYANRNEEYPRQQKKLQEAPISPENKELITRFDNYLFSTGSQYLRVSKMIYQLRKLCLWGQEIGLKSDLNALNGEDLQRLVAHINKIVNLSEVTKADYKRGIKQFFKWYKDQDERLESQDPKIRTEAKKLYHYVEKDLKRSFKQTQANPNTILTDEDIQAVLEKGTDNQRDNAFICLLHETGARVGEFLNLRIGDIEIKNEHAVMHINEGKTGKRVVFVVKSLPYLMKYLEFHPLRQDKNAFLWVSHARQNKEQPLRYIGGQKLIDKAFLKAKINKKHNFHWFRHSRATILAPKLTQPLLCKYMGWTLGSQQVKTYLHLSVKQLENEILELNGLNHEEKDKDKPLKCICGNLNHPTAKYCFKCFRPLSVDVAIKDNASQMREVQMMNTEYAKTINFFMQVSQDKDLMQKFLDFKKRIEEKS